MRIFPIQTKDGFQKCSSPPPGTRLKHRPGNSSVLKKSMQSSGWKQMMQGGKLLIPFQI